MFFRVKKSGVRGYLQTGENRRIAGEAIAPADPGAVAPRCVNDVVEKRLFECRREGPLLKGRDLELVWAKPSATGWAGLSRRGPKAGAPGRNSQAVARKTRKAWHLMKRQLEGKITAARNALAAV